MIRLHILFQWRYSVNDLKRIFGQLDKGKPLDVTFFDIAEYTSKHVSKADVILLHNVIRRDAVQIVREARQAGVKVIYYCDIDKKLLDSSDERLRIAATLFFDVRAANTRDMLLRTADLVLSDGDWITSEHAFITPYFRRIEKTNPETWRTLIESALESPPQKRTFTEGKKILFISPTFMWPHHYISDILAQSLMNMGHRVYLFTPRPTRFHSETICWTKHFSDTSAKQIADYQEDIWKVPPFIDQDTPDLVLTVQGYTIPRQILQEIKKRGVSFAVWLMDEPYDTLRSSSFSRYFSHVFIQDRASLSYQRHAGNPNTFYLPHGCDPLEHDDEKSHTYKRDIALVGSPFPRRVDLVKKLLKTGMRVTVVGNGWQEAFNTKNDALTIMGNISLAEARRFYRETKITLNMHRSEDDFTTNKGMFKPLSPNGTTFFIAGSDAFQLVDTGRDEIKDLFIPDEEVAMFSGSEECIEKVRYYLTHDKERQKVCSAGRRRAQREHTYEHRLETLLQTIDSECIIPLDSGHRKVGFITFSSGDAALTHLTDSRLSEAHAVTVLMHSTPKSDLSAAVKVIEIPKDKGFSFAVNAAVLETPADYIVVGEGSVMSDQQKIGELIHAFSEDIALGAILLKRSQKNDYTGFIVPIRIMNDLGAFRLDNATLSVDDMRYRLEEMGYEVKEVAFDGPPLDSVELSLPSTEEDMNTFRTEWTDNPDSRIKARKLLKSVQDNSFRLTKAEGLTLVKKASELSPDYLEGKKRLGELLLQDGRIGEAKECFAHVWERKPDNINSALMYSVALFLAREYAHADEVLDAILAGNCESAERASAYYQKGLIRKKNEKTDEAITCFETALQYDAAHRKALNEIALIHFEIGETDRAITLLKDSLYIEEHDETMNDIGVMYWHAGDKGHAYEWFIKALTKNPANRSAVMNLVTVGKELHKLNEAKEYLYDCLNYYPNDRELLKLAETLKTGR